MKILFRVDSSILIGSGHVMRCLTLARYLAKLGHQVYFLMEALPGNLISFVNRQGFITVDSLFSVDIIIVDHYEIDIIWENQARDYCKKIVVIDDLANRKHNCNLLIDPNMVKDYASRYDKLVPAHCVKLLGFDYFFLRDEFIQIRSQFRRRTRESIDRLLIFMGGSDPTGETVKFLQALEESDTRFRHIDIVVGEGNPHKEWIATKCKQLKIEFHCQIDYIATLMEKADVAFGAGGGSLWERSYLGLPSYSTIVADNQFESTKMAEEMGLTINLGWHSEVDVKRYKTIIEELPLRTAQLERISQICLETTANYQKIESWVKVILEL